MTPIKIFDIDCRLDYQIHGPCEFLLQIHALSGMDQVVLSESLHIGPGDAAASHRIFADPYLGHRFTRLRAEPGMLNIHYRARVQRHVHARPQHAPALPIAQLPDDVLHNLMPTRYCESDLLGRVAQKTFGHLPPGQGQVQAISDWIHDNIDYQIGSTNSATTARDVFLQRAGVCRDFAHLGIAFCRALNIPARLVAGHVRFDDPPPDFHAVFEAYLGGQWLLFDPTRMAPMDDLVRIASGRDAKDLAFATIFGPATLISMAPEVRPVL